MPYVTRRSDIIEEQGVRSVTLGILAAVLLIGGLVLLWGGNIAKHGAEANSVRDVYVAPGFWVLGGIGVLVGLIVGGVAVNRMVKARKQPSVSLECPYCGHPVKFPVEPTEDWDCEHCHRQVQYENGQQVPIKLITCAFCSTEHKVSAKATHFMCDRCNRPLRLTDPGDTKAVVSDQKSDILRNYDVVLTQVGRRPNDVALALESILICNLKDARQRMEDLPLTVTRNVPERKADAVRRRLRDLGATAVMRPTDEAEQGRQARR